MKIEKEGMQADQKVAKAQQAAADAVQRSHDELSALRRELELTRKEKRGLVQRCTSADREVANAQVSIDICQHLSHPSCYSALS